MRVDMLMPQMGESITEATILKWKKAQGERVNKDEIILEISTDKVDSEIPAPSSGVLAEVLFNEGDVVPVKSKIATIDTEASSAASPSAPKAEASRAESKSVAPAAAEQPYVATSQSNGHTSASSSSFERFYSPLVKSLAEKHGVSVAELDAIQGTGHSARVSKEDLMRYIDNRSRGTAQTNTVQANTVQPMQVSRHAEESTRAAQPAVSAPQVVSVRVDNAVATQSAPAQMVYGDDVEIIPMDNMRQAIADHMVRSKHTSPHVYSVTEVDVSKIAKWRTEHQAEFLKREGFKLSFTPFFLEAAVKGLLKFPQINASVDGKKIIVRKKINLGCAVALGTTGLIVPVIKGADEKTFVGIARGLNDLAQRARTKKLSPDDVKGGTFTVTNPGVFGTIIGYPIINQPQVAILSLGSIKKRPVVVDDMIAIREMCYLSLSYDHRIVDGAMGGSFLAFVRDYLESWDMEKTLY